MSSSEKFCLNWNDFQKNISSSFQEMRDNLDLADVTLACEDRKQVQAHKFVLSASSPFFKEILLNNKHPHPLIYLKGVKYEALESVLDFLYMGEVNIYQEYLNDFLALAEDLELKGLTGQEPKENVGVQDNIVTEETPEPRANSIPRHMLMPKVERSFEQSKSFININNAESRDVETRDIAVINVSNDDLNSTIESLIEKTGDSWNCKMCGQKATQKITLKRHVESKHTSGGSHPCKVCGKVFRSSHSLCKHMPKCDEK